MHPVHRLRCVAVVILAVLVAVLATPFRIPSATAADAPSVRLNLTGVTPRLASATTDVKVTGTVTNTSGSPVNTPTIAAQLGTHLLDTTAKVTQWNSGTSQLGLDNVAQSKLGSLTPGQSETFSLTIPKTRFNLGYSSYASLPLNLAVTAGSAPLGHIRSTISWQSASASVASPMKTNVIIPLTLPADPALFGASGAARDAAWNKAIGPDSQVTKLLDAFAGQPVTWLIDPQLLDPPAAADDNLPALPATPTATATASPTSSDPSATPDQAAAKSAIDTLTEALAARLKARSSSEKVWWTPYDDPDVSALTGSTQGQALLVRDLQRTLPSALQAISTTTAMWPTTALTASQLTAIRSAWAKAGHTPDTLIVPTRSVENPLTTTTSATRRLSTGGGAVVYDERLSALFADATIGDAQQRAQHFLAYSLAVYQQQPGLARSLALVVPRSLAVTPTDLAATYAAVLQAPWIAAPSADPLSKQLGVSPQASVLRTPYQNNADEPSFPVSGSNPITDQVLHSVATSHALLATLGSVVQDDTGAVGDRERGVDVLGGARWRGQGTRLATAETSIRSGVLAMMRKITVNASTVNFFSDSGQLIVTVINDLNRPVKNVELTLQPRKYLLSIKDPTQEVSLKANSRGVVRFPVQALAAGNVPIDAVLTAPEQTGRELTFGAAPGHPIQLQVNVRPTSSWIYWVLGIVAGLVLIIGLLRSTRGGPRGATVQPGGSEPTPDNAIVATGHPQTNKDE